MVEDKKGGIAWIKQSSNARSVQGTSGASPGSIMGPGIGLRPSTLDRFSHPDPLYYMQGIGRRGTQLCLRFN